MQEIIYYRFKKNYVWLILNLLLLAGLLSCLCKSLSFAFWWEFQVLIVLLTLWLLVWIYKYVMKIPMAVIDDETIKIDHTKPLRWKDVEAAEERMVSCPGLIGKRKVIVLIPKKDIDYKYNYLQRHNGEFTPFSVPLYGILTPEDEERITKIIAAKVGLKRLES